MQVFLLRHGIAAASDPRRYPDDGVRPLLAKGRARIRMGARGMAKLGIKVDLILTSPLLRARQTARATAYGLRPRPEVRVDAGLAPGVPPSEIVERLLSLHAERLLLVGHEPNLSGLASWLLAGTGGEVSLDFKKGALCGIEFAGKVGPGKGCLLFHLPPRALRRLGRT